MSEYEIAMARIEEGIKELRGSIEVEDDGCCCRHTLVNYLEANKADIAESFCE